MRSILIGNLISACASVFLAASCVVNEKRRAYFFQMMESQLLMVSSCFFGVWSSVTTHFLCVVRNGLVMKEKFNTVWMVVCMSLTVGIGIAVNNRGVIGLIPIAATIQLTLCNYFVKSIRGVKLSFLVNGVLWVVYAFCIQDYACCITTTTINVLTVISLLRLGRAEKAKA